MRYAKGSFSTVQNRSDYSFSNFKAFGKPPPPPPPLRRMRLQHSSGSVLQYDVGAMRCGGGEYGLL